MNMPSRPFPMHVPTLTEVVDEPPVAELTPVDPALTHFVADLIAQPAPTIDVAVLTEVVSEQDLLPEPMATTSEDEWPQTPPPVEQLGQVFVPDSVAAPEHDLSAQLTDQLTAELTEALRPILDQHTQALVQDLRAMLDKRLRDMVAQAVANELAHQRQN